MGWGLSEPFQGMAWGQGHIVKIILAHRGNSALITGREGDLFTGMKGDLLRRGTLFFWISQFHLHEWRRHSRRRVTLYAC